MSYAIKLTIDDVPVEVGHHRAGAIFPIGGSSEARMHVTYNYSRHFCRVLDAEQGIRWLYGKTGAETVARLLSAIEALRDDVAPDYWEPTEGNARLALVTLLSWALLYPRAVWQGD